MLKENIKKYTPKKLLDLFLKIYRNYFGGYSKKSYSQEGEDLILMRIFEKQKIGFYLDVGAHHPKRFSNTYLFYKKGWKGINIDARPGSMKSFNKSRSRDINIEAAISKKPQKLNYYMFDEPAINGFSQEISSFRNKNSEYNIKEVIEIKTVRLDDLLQEQYLEQNTIDFLNIDVEGLDFEVLQSINLEKYNVRVICIEALKSSLNEINNHEISAYLELYGYQPYAKAVNTVIYKKENFDEK